MTGPTDLVAVSANLDSETPSMIGVSAMNGSVALHLSLPTRDETLMLTPDIAKALAAWLLNRAARAEET